LRSLDTLLHELVGERAGTHMGMPSTAHLQPGMRVALVDEALSRADLARRAIAALECVVLDEGSLKRMKVAGLPSPSIV
jgi:hypothetical protein